MKCEHLELFTLSCCDLMGLTIVLSSINYSETDNNIKINNNLIYIKTGRGIALYTGDLKRVRPYHNLTQLNNTYGDQNIIQLSATNYRLIQYEDFRHNMCNIYQNVLIKLPTFVNIKCHNIYYITLLKYICVKGMLFHDLLDNIFRLVIVACVCDYYVSKFRSAYIEMISNQSILEHLNLSGLNQQKVLTCENTIREWFYNFYL